MKAFPERVNLSFCLCFWCCGHFISESKIKMKEKKKKAPAAFRAKIFGMGPKLVSVAHIAVLTNGF